MEITESEKERLKLYTAISEKGYSVKGFAEILGCGYSTLRNALNGKKRLTKQLKRHIKLALQIAPFNSNIARWTCDNTEFMLPPRIYHAIEEEATVQGISTAELMQNLFVRLATDFAKNIVWCNNRK